ncbi:unnamed protein product, partial [Rotaria sp. Silwood1]
MSANHSKTIVIKCKKCNEVISPDEKYLHDGENTVHIHCYNCSSCNKSLAGMFYYRYKDLRDDEKKNLYCDSCYYRLAPVCFQCLKIIDDISLTYGERIFHPNCFCCDHCQKAFKGALVFPYENHIYCSNCYKNVQNDFHPASSIVSTLRCSICRKQFQPGDLITKHQIDLPTDKISNNIHYIHNSCFVCGICHQNLSNTMYYSPNTHDEDFQSLVFQYVTDSSVMSGHLSIGDRWRIISLSLDQGMTTNQIASVINCTSRTVRNILQLFRETNNVIEREERG